MRDFDAFDERQSEITKISQVTPEVTLFLRRLGFTNYYIIKIFSLVGDAAIGLTEDDPYWLLEEFPHMKFSAADEAALKLGFGYDSYYRIQAAIKHGLSSYVREGHTFVPARDFCIQIGQFLAISSESVEDVMEDMALSGELQLTLLDGKEVLYFYGYYKTECEVVSKVAALSSRKPVKIAANIDAVIKGAESRKGINLSEEQRKAVKSSLEHGMSIITGGPGTGKTTIISMLITILQEAGLKTEMAAPTGRAAKRITEATGKGAMTVHRLLEYYYDEGAGHMAFGRNAMNKLECDAVIVDEASMMDLMLTGALLRALKDDSILIFTGDADQLPSVGAGNVLRDMIESGYVYTSRLTEIFRQAEESNIVINAHRINRGDYPSFGGDFVLEEADKQQDILDRITAITSGCDPEKVQILTPTKKGLLGSVNLNVYLQKVFNPPSDQKPEMSFGNRIYRVGDKVMQIKNNYRLEYKKKDGRSGKGVFNGEMGVVEAIHPEDKKISVRYDDDRWVEYPYIQLDEIEPAYAVTVHKSQGSEFDTVIIPMSWFPPALATRNLIYTAVTRAKKKVCIVGRRDYLNAMVDNESSGKRNSGLRQRLEGIYENI